ncbi:MAG: serine/threonine-protein kinase, partial [Acidimicrobiales bacterium]
MPDSPPAHRAPPSAFPAGRLISGRYRLDRRIASGGMAEVWEATDEVLGRPVAVKILHPHLAADDTFVLRFRSEAIAAA